MEGRQVAHNAEQVLHEHGKSIDSLHEKLKADCRPEKQADLQRHVDEYQAAHKKFHDAALGCMN